MDFKAAAREVLREIALESGYLESTGRTPPNTMRARLSVDVRDNPGTPFVQTAPGVYGLKSAFEPLSDAVY